MNYDKACEWFDELVYEIVHDRHSTDSDKTEYLSNLARALNHEVDSERIAELVYEIVHDRHSTDSDKTEYLSNLARALALHASIYYLFEKNRMLRVG